MMRALLIFDLISVGVLLLAYRGQVQGRRRAVLGGAMALVGLVLTKAWVEVPPATVGAIYDPLRGGILPYDVAEGWCMVPPWATVRLFSVRTQNYTMGGLAQEASEQREDAIQCQTAEGLSLSIDCTVLFHISPGDAHRLWRSVGPNYVGVVVRPNVREAARIVISEYPIMSVYSNATPATQGIAGVDFYPGKRQEVADRIQQRLAERLAEKGITLERFLLRNVDYMQEAFERSIVDKQVAQQRVVTQQYEAEIQRIRAQANVVRAEGDAEAIRLKAEALRVQPKVIEWEMVQQLPQDIDVMILPEKVMPLISTSPESVTAPPPPMPSRAVPPPPLGRPPPQTPPPG